MHTEPVVWKENPNVLLGLLAKPNRHNCVHAALTRLST